MDRVHAIDRKIFISTGELSGETHACHLVESLNKTEGLRITAMGSERLAAAGVTVVRDYRDISVTGLSEVLSHAGNIRRAFDTVKTHIRAERPDLVVLVDPDRWGGGIEGARCWPVTRRTIRGTTPRR